MPAQDNNNLSYYKDWDYRYPGTRTRDIQNRYPVPNKPFFGNSFLKFKDTTNTNSNTWRHKNLDYQGLYRPNDDSDEDDYKRKRYSESKSSED